MTPDERPPTDDATDAAPTGKGRNAGFTREGRADRLGLIANIPGMVYQAHLEKSWPMEFVSAGALELTGYPADDFLRDGPRSFGGLIHAQDQERVWGEVVSAVDEDRGFSVEYRIHHRDGEIRHVWDHGQAILDAGGKVLRVEGIILDVTERVRLSEQLRHAQRRETVGRLSGVVAHDFNNYLTGILGSLELAREDLAPGSAAWESVELALQAGREARDLTRQLLLVSRSRPQKRELVDLTHRVLGLHAFLDQVVGSPVDLRLDGHDRPLPVLIDPVLVDQVLLNLVVNAREALSGYGRVVIRTRPDGDDRVVLEVQDDGHGMDVSVQQRAFDPFFTTKEAGTGLGLATVKAIVTELGGTVELRSAPGAGCTCRIVLPRGGLTAARPDGPGEGTAPGPRRGHGQRVLVVDDDPTVLRLVSRVLRRFGYDPLEALDPDECKALMRAQREPPALAILDVTLPGCSGMQLAEELRREGLLGPTLYMSGYAPEEMVTGSESLRDTLYLEKPFSVKELLAAVATSLDQADGGGAEMAGAG